MQASHRTGCPISTLCKIANTTCKPGQNSPKAASLFCRSCSRALAHAPHPESGILYKKGLFFWLFYAISFQSVNGKACGSKELRRLFIGGIFQAPKPLWMLIFIDKAAQSQRTNQSFINKNRALFFYHSSDADLFFSVEKFN